VGSGAKASKLTQRRQQPGLVGRVAESGVPRLAAGSTPKGPQNMHAG